MRTALDSMSFANAKGPSSAWDPSQADTALKFRFRGDILTTDSGDVDQWTDQGPNGIHLLQSDSAKRCLYIADAINGRAGVQGDGVDEFLVSTVTTTFARPLEIWAFARIDAYDASNYVMMMQGDGTAKMMLYGYPGGPNYVALDWAGASVANSADAPAIGGWHLFRFLAKAGSGNSEVEIDNDGSPTTGTISADPTASQPLSLFARTDGTNPGLYTIAEILGFDGEPTANDRINMVSYVNDYYTQSF